MTEFNWKSISPDVARALAVRGGLRFYAKTGLKINRGYTPAAMMRVAREITGQTFRPRDYLGAVGALNEWLLKRRASDGPPA